MEARLVDALREAGLISLALVAEEDGRVIGDAVYSPMTCNEAREGLTAVCLGPLAVLPEYQRKGVGSALVRHGIELCREAGFDVMALLGSTAYYGRFGFVLADILNLLPDDAEIPKSHFQAMMLRGNPPPTLLHLKYAPQFFMK